MKAITRSIHITSKKINLIAGLVRRKQVTEAMNILKFTPKKAAKILNKIIRSAVANAENNFKQERPSLYIQEIIVTEGPTMKRSVPVSRGRANPILKRTSHVRVILGVKDGEEISMNKKTAKIQEAASKETTTVKKTGSNSKKVSKPKTAKRAPTPSAAKASKK